MSIVKDKKTLFLHMTNKEICDIIRYMGALFLSSDVG